MSSSLVADAFLLLKSLHRFSMNLSIDGIDYLNIRTGNSHAEGWGAETQRRSVGHLLVHQRYNHTRIESISLVVWRCIV